MNRPLAFAACLFLLCGFVTAQTAGTAGAFARMGFGARGMGMGNAMTAVVTGEISSYYNPALPAFAENRFAAGSFGRSAKNSQRESTALENTTAPGRGAVGCGGGGDTRKRKEV